MSELSPLSTPAQECTSLLSPSALNLLFSFLILFGILISYLPQHIRIIKRGTSEGISPLFLLLGVTSGTCALLNILVLSWGVLGCCRKGIGGFNCFAASMGVAQVGTQWACFAIILALFLIYFPRQGALGIPITSTAPSQKVAVTTTLVSIVHFVAMTTATFYISLLRSGTTQQNPNSPPQPSDALVKWANFLGVQSTILASIQYIPQLFTTWRLKHVGSLSIPMMCIQTPGSFVWAMSLATREGTRWSSWATYVVTGVLQGCLLAMCIMWELADRKTRTKADQVIDTAGSESREEEDERQPLLATPR
ncbi:hypothetical protein K440DRAFT_554726 [Wilcoxina mikolae CBS 423.85]|nr:hypothetical protein K440DRAFT_554726 [Wilcoxina mikolae CBS 423.85]